jgi:hypothetical protein
MPTIRAIRPTDIIPLMAFFRNGSHREVTAQVWPEVQGVASARVMREIIRRLMVHPGGYPQARVCVADGRICGLAVAWPRAGKLAWDVRDLFVAEDDHMIGVELLEQATVEAARRGARRVFLATTADGEMARLARQGGFVQYTSEVLFAIKLASPIADGNPRPARPRLRQDTLALFQLYNAAVPCKVRFAEAMTMDEWVSLDRGSRPWAPRLSGNNLHCVWDEQGGLAGWLQLMFGSRSQHMSLLVHPSHSGETEEMVRYSLGQVSHKVPVYVSAREYQPELISALETMGFWRAAEYMVFAREMTARVPSRAFVPARA